MVPEGHWKNLRDQISRQFSILESNADPIKLRASEESDAMLSIDGKVDRIVIPCHLQKVERREVLDGMSTLVTEGEGHSRFVIEALSDRREMFIPFITDVLMLSAEMPPDSAFEEALKDWKELWKGKTGRLSEPQQRGLFGELVVLRALVGYSNTATNYWTGPSNSIHDFTSEKLHIEVKTTSKQPPSVRISQIGQVAPLQGSAELALIVVGIEKGGESSLIDKIEELRAWLRESPQAILFEKMLRKSGFRDSHAQHYQRRYATSFTQIHWITGSSPVIDPQRLGDIPSTVKNIRYDLDVYAMEMTPISDNEWKKISRKLVG